MAREATRDGGVANRQGGAGMVIPGLTRDRHQATLAGLSAITREDPRTTVTREGS